MRKIAIINQKGGVGKTTTAVNLSAGLARAGQRVCLADMDPQSHASLHLGLGALPDERSMYDVLIGDTPLSDVRRQAADNLWIVGAHIDLAAVEVELAGANGREVILRDKLAADSDLFDYWIIDCPPSLGVLTLNALSAVDEVFIPLQPHFLALHGLSKLLETTSMVARRVNPQLRVTGVVLCLYESATKLAAEVARNVNEYLEQGRRKALPWSDAHAFAARIRRNVRLAEAPSFGQSIFDYAPDSPGAEDYEALAAEVLQQHQRLALVA